MSSDGLRISQVTLRPGCPVAVVDLSSRGIQVQSARPLRPGSRVLVLLPAGDQIVTLGAEVLRCAVWALDPDEGVTYRGGLRFDEFCPPIWDDDARASTLTNAPP